MNGPRLLFLKTKHIGDALLMTPALAAVREQYPAAEITVVVRAGTEGILAGCPAIDRLLTTAAPESDRRDGARWRDLALVRELRRRRFDIAFELGDCDRGRWLAWLSGARVRCGARRHVRLGPVARRLLNRWCDVDWLQLHRAEKDFQTVREALPLDGPVPPLTFARERAQPWPQSPAESSFAVLHPTARWAEKRWPTDRWVDVGRHLLARLDRVVISSGPAPEERAEAARLVGALGPPALSTDGQTTWAQLAGLLWRARLFAGVDTAAMHLAAACQCPTVALFGPSIAGYWRPWRVAHEVVAAAGRPEFATSLEHARELRRAETGAIPVPAVIAACDRLLAAGRGA